MRVLIACEFSGTVRNAFIAQGHDAWSCDLLPSEVNGPHVQCSCLDILDDNWDLMIAHPPCTHLAVCGAKWFKKKHKRQRKALNFFLKLLNAPIPHIAIENPIGVVSTKICPPDQIIQPYWFGDPHRKTTCLWLKNLPKLKPTNKVKVEFDELSDGTKIPSIQKQWFYLPKDIRGHERSRTFEGIAKAMADQWGKCQKYVTGFGLSVKHRIK